MAVGDRGGHWWVVNASPDISVQLSSFGGLHPRGSGRSSPLSGVLLTNADLDHTLGLITLRQGPIPPVYATAAVRRTLEDSLGLNALVGAFSPLAWKNLPSSPEPLLAGDGSEPEISARAILLPGSAPRFAARHRDQEAGHSAAIEFTDLQNGARCIVAPDVGEITAELGAALEGADLVLFDGAFWSDNELKRLDPDARTSRAMGHLPIQDGSMPLLARSGAKRTIFMHINNTNPILNPHSTERATLAAAGLEVGEDGLTFEL